MPKITDKKTIKRNNILDAAYNLFVTKSVHNTAIDDVVKKAGIAKGTFYLYFRDKYDLLDQIILRKSSSLLTEALTLTNEKFKNQTDAKLSDISWYFTSIIIDRLEKNKDLTLLINKDVGACLRTLTKTTDETLINAIKEILTAFHHFGISIEQAKQKLYIIVELVGSICCQSILYASPYTLDESKPILETTIKKILD